MSAISATKTIDAPVTAVWDVLADFGNIANWTDQVTTSFSIGDVATGVGEGRHCDLSPAGSIDETITEYVPERRLSIDIHNTKKLPIKSSKSTFTLNPVGPNRTEVTMSADPTFKGGPVGAVLKKLAGGKLTQGLAGLLDDLGVAAERHARSNA